MMQLLVKLKGQTFEGVDISGVGELTTMSESTAESRLEFWKEKSSASKSLEHSLSSHQVKKEWYTFLKFQKKE